MIENVKIINHIMNGNVTKLKSDIGSVIGEKVMNMIKDRRVEVSKQMFSGTRLEEANKPKISISKYIRSNRKQLKKYIMSKVDIKAKDIDDDEIEIWILNDEDLYNEAIRNNVDV